MIVKRRSLFSGKYHEMDLPITEEEIEEGQVYLPSPDLLIVVRGSLHSHATERNDKTCTGSPAHGHALGPGTVLNWQNLLLERAHISAPGTARHPTTCRLVASSDAIIWSIPASRFEDIAASFPEFGLQLSADIQASLEDERTRMSALLPYLVSAPRRGLLGSSKYAVRLQQAVNKAAADESRAPVLIFGEAGLEKARLAALVHFSGPARERPVVRVESSQPIVDLLWGEEDIPGSSVGAVAAAAARAAGDIGGVEAAAAPRCPVRVEGTPPVVVAGSLPSAVAAEGGVASRAPGLFYWLRDGRGGPSLLAQQRSPLALALTRALH